MSKTQVFSAILIAILFQISHQNPSKSTKTPIEKTIDYNGCETEYQCFGIPNNCSKDSKSECIALLKTKASKTGADFILYWARHPSSGDSWIGAGISDDDKMGNDSVTVFKLNKGDVKIDWFSGLTFNEGKGENETGVTKEIVMGITNVTADYTDGLLTGQWSRTEDTEVGKLDFNLKSNKYYILLAYGPVDNTGNLSHHSNSGASDSAVDLEKDSSVNPNVTSTTLAPTTTPVPTTTPIPTTTPKATTTEAPKTSTTSESTVTTKATTPETTEHTDTSTGMTTESSTESNETTSEQPESTTHHKGGASATITLSFMLAFVMAIIFSLNV